MHSLSLEDAPRVQRFLGFYLEVVKEQSKKQLTTSKSNFYKVAKDHFRGVARIWNFFNEQQVNMIFDKTTQQLTLLNFNQFLFSIASKLDKLLMLLVHCGFSLTNLLSEPENNVYVESMTHMISKLELYVKCVEQISKAPDSAAKEKFYPILVNQVKTFIKHLAEIQTSESLLMYNTLDKYV
jgi:hypothetical protein